MRHQPAQGLSEGAASAAGPLVDEYTATARARGPVRALRFLRDRLERAPSAAWRDCARTLVARHNAETAVALLEFSGVLREQPDMRVALGEALGAAGDYARATDVLQPLLPQADAALAMAGVLAAQGRTRAAAQLLEGAAAAATPATVVRYAYFLMEWNQQAAAQVLCERALAGAPEDGPLLAIAGLLDVALGRFGSGRARLLDAMRRQIDREIWLLAPSVAAAQRYDDPAHPDLALFQKLLDRPGAPAAERASLMFALAKAHDDLEQYERAAALYRGGNDLVRAETPWSRERWNEWIAMQLAWPPVAAPSPMAPAGFTPVFIVGMPRSGTTLVAEILARHPEVRARGEMGVVPQLRHWLAPPARSQNPAAVAEARGRLLAQLRQDDEPVAWYIDKNPLNYRYLGLVAALAPESRVIYCRRSLRDTALSIWKQYFARPDIGFAYAFEYMTDLFDSCAEMMLHWQAQLDLPILTVEYEQLVADPEAASDGLAKFLGLPELDLLAAPPRPDAAIATASRWQARQPIYQRSVGAWRAYAPYVPELERLFPDTSF
jgi:hypothetical protein